MYLIGFYGIYIIYHLPLITMLLANRNACRKQNPSIKNLNRKQSLIKIASTSKIPKDFFRPHSSQSQDK